MLVLLSCCFTLNLHQPDSIITPFLVLLSSDLSQPSFIYHIPTANYTELKHKVNM